MDDTALKKRKMIIPLLMAILAPLKPAQVLINSMPEYGKYSDMPALYTALRMIVSGAGATIYDTSKINKLIQSYFPGMREGTWTLLPPFSIVWLAPLGLLPENIALAAWTVVLCLLLIACIFLSRLVFELSLAATLWLFAILCLFAPAFEAIRVGQLSPLLLFCFLAAMLAVRRNSPLLAGLSLSVMLLKPQLLLPLIVILLGGGKFRPLLWLAAFATAIGAISLLLIGPGGYEQYLSRLAALQFNTETMAIEITPTMRGQMLRLFPGFINQVNFATTLISLLGLGACFAWSRRFSQRPDWLMLSIASAIPLALATSVYFQIYDLLLLLPAVLALITSDVGKQMPVWTRFAGMALLGVYTLPVYVPLHYGYLLSGGAINIEFIALAVYALAIQIIFLKAEAVGKSS